MTGQGRILVIDDEDGIRKSLGEILRDDGHEVATASTPDAGIERCRATDFDVVLLDVWLPGRDGLSVLEEIRRMTSPPEVVMISGHGTVETAVRATKLGAFDFLEKPLSLEKTLLTARHALEKKRQVARQEDERDAFLRANAIVGQSQAVKHLIDEVRTAAPTNGRVLVFGENGTGKELVARHVHHHSLRKDGAFVEVNCAAIPDELIESELFGHVRGSFTGAVANKRGKFALADGGTLFLDEIGDMSLRTQARVLRALQEQVVTPVGSAESLSVDVRVIAATNKALEDEIKKGNFREDLFFRLNVIPLHVPPLRERREDIPLLMRHFLDLFGREHGRERKEPDESALSALMAHQWPGNVRELKNVAERLVIMEPGRVIQREHLPRAIRGDAEDVLRLAGRFGSLKDARDAFEREYILKVLRDEAGNVSAAARSLGLERSSLYRKARSLQIPLEGARLD
jgi:two-component system nitrogen regulation response regulator NtrX